MSSISASRRRQGLELLESLGSSPDRKMELGEKVRCSRRRQVSFNCRMRLARPMRATEDAVAGSISRISTLGRRRCRGHTIQVYGRIYRFWACRSLLPAKRYPLEQALEDRMGGLGGACEQRARSYCAGNGVSTWSAAGLSHDVLLTRCVEELNRWRRNARRVLPPQLTSTSSTAGPRCIFDPSSPTTEGAGATARTASSKPESQVLLALTVTEHGFRCCTECCRGRPRGQSLAPARPRDFAATRQCSGGWWSPTEACCRRTTCRPARGWHRLIVGAGAKPPKFAAGSLR